ncbi:imidazolonepropionase [Brevundimonas sp.]|uniref:imidazolonepropionase n=1 Tax=Brevundimonas sp. TaxID=1871086 RepID=UPI002D1FAF64|nr:imidazolonepropionase [Brevundimonas sp.]
MWDTLLIDGHAATMVASERPYGAILNAALAMEAGRIVWIGAQADLPGAPGDLAQTVESLDGRWITPGLIDCHTHLVFGSNRAVEWEMRLNGATYEEIARAGGGILSSVKATRGATQAELVASAQHRLNALAAAGATTVEIKSGYGLDLDSELKMLRAAGDLTGARIVRTLLAAHALPPEFKDNRAGYIDLICEQIIPAAARAGLADAVDAFCESIGFSPDEVTRVFQAARAHGLPVKLHAEQLTNQHGAALTARYHGLSADHLEHLDDEGIAAMAEAGTVAVLLPGAFYFLKDTKLPPIQALRDAGVPVAVATDCNPGTSPLTSLPLAMNMACTLFGLTPEEALAGCTRHGAAALGLADQIGTLEVGKAADLAVWNIDEPAELAYWLGAAPLSQRWLSGRNLT